MNPFPLAGNTCADDVTIISTETKTTLAGSYNYAGEHNGVPYYTADSGYLYRAGNGNWHLHNVKFHESAIFWAGASDCPFDSITWHSWDTTINSWAPLSGFSVKGHTHGKIVIKI